MSNTNTHNNLTGTVIISVEQLFSIVKAAVASEMRQLASKKDEVAVEEKKEYSALEAAEILKYKTKATLRQFHHLQLTPIRRGRHLFYRADEVLKLKRQLFNQ